MPRRPIYRFGDPAEMLDQYFTITKSNWLDKCMSTYYIDPVKRSAEKAKTYRHIRYKAELLKPSHDTVKVTILEQTHLRRDFGNTYGGYSFEYNGYTLSSFSFPQCVAGNLAYVRGGSESDHNRSFLLKVDEYVAFKAAVVAYNAYFDGSELGLRDKKKAAVAVKKAATKKRPDGKVKRSPTAVVPEPWTKEAKNAFYFRAYGGKA